MGRGTLILAVDQGTTNTKSVLMDGAVVVASASRPVEVSFPRPGWVEQDAFELWTSVREAVAECLSQAPDANIAALGITNQRESAIVWDRRTGEPAGPCVIWQCRRTAPFCAELRERGLSDLIQERTGLAVDPLFSASKIRWLLSGIHRGFERAAAGELCAGTVDSWLLWRFTSGAVHATDATNASRTQLLNLRTAQWDNDLLGIFKIPANCLPEVRPSSGVFGHTSGNKLPEGIPIASMIGDSHAALFGHAAFTPGSVKATYGTGSSLMTLTEQPVASNYGLSSTVAWARDGEVKYALEGNITNSGATVQWFGEFLGLSSAAEEAASLASTVDDAGGVYIVPAFAGLGAPHWDAEARGLISGLTRASRSAHVARAALESIAYQVRDVFEAMRQDMGIAPPVLLADGGASRNDTLMQFQADILDRPVVRTLTADLSIRGCAWLAGLAIGYWNSLCELEALPRETQRFEPRFAESRRTELISGWNDAVSRARTRH